MKNCKLPLFLIVFVSLVFCTVPRRAEGVYYNSEGVAIKTYSVPKMKKKEPTKKKTVTQKKVTPSPKSIVPKKEKTFSDPSEAAAAGYKVGQTVMVKKGIIYKLAQDSKTGKYTYKRYRKKKKKTFSNPSEAVAAGYKVGQTVMVKKGIIYKLAQDSKTGKYTFKRYRAAKPKTAQTDVAVKAQTESEARLKEKAEIKAQEDAAEKARIEAINQEQKEQLQYQAESDARLKEKAEVKAQKDAAEKVRTEATAEAKRTKQEQARKERRQYQTESRTSNGRNMNRLNAAVSLRHSFLDRKTVITDRTLTDGGSTTSSTTDVGRKDTYSTDMHNDSVRLRLGLTDRVEMFLDAGLAYEKLSDISDMEPAYGGGFRVNITTVDDGYFSGLYLAFSSEYLQGKLTTSYSSADGTKYSQATDWEDITATMESGIVFSKLSIFAGCSYMLYSESMNTKEIQPLPDITLLEDDLEQQSSLNFSGGVEYHYSPSQHIQLEVQAPNRLGGIVSVEYLF